MREVQNRQKYTQILCPSVLEITVNFNVLAINLLLYDGVHSLKFRMQVFWGNAFLQLFLGYYLEGFQTDIYFILILPKINIIILELTFCHKHMPVGRKFKQLSDFVIILLLLRGNNLILLSQRNDILFAFLRSQRFQFIHPLFRGEFLTAFEFGIWELFLW